MRAQLNDDQEADFTVITTAIVTDPWSANFYLQGEGGSGKTFLYQTLCYYYRGQGKTFLCVASTGIAALLLPEGRTSHSQFNIPIELNEGSVSGIEKQSMLAAQLRKVDLIIWDEVPMHHKYCFEVVHRLLVDSQGSSEDFLFGGVPVIFGGDCTDTFCGDKWVSRCNGFGVCTNVFCLGAVETAQLTGEYEGPGGNSLIGLGTSRTPNHNVTEL